MKNKKKKKKTYRQYMYYNDVERKWMYSIACVSYNTFDYVILSCLDGDNDEQSNLSLHSFPRDVILRELKEKKIKWKRVFWQNIHHCRFI